MKNGTIILCSGIKMDKEYENVLSFSENDMVSLCQTNKIFESNNNTFIGNNNYVEVECPYETAMFANYMAFINPNFGNKWFFAWVTDVKLLSPNVSRVYFQIDVWSTWYSRFNLGKAFIEREHVSDDTIGKHTIPEGLETGEYITQTTNNSTADSLTNMYYLSDICIIVAVSETGLGLTVPSGELKYNGLYSGLRYLCFLNGSDLESYIKNVQEHNTSDVIYSIFVAPYSLTGLQASDFTTVPASSDITYSFTFAYVPASNSEKDMNSFYIQKPQFLDSDYTPVNKKLLTFPYCFFNMTNNVGEVKDYHYELFGTSTCSFQLRGAIGVGCSIKAYPISYAFKGTNSDTAENRLHSMDGSKLPTCNWVTDPYVNWLTGNSVNLALSTVKDIAQIGISTATANVGGVAGGFFGIAGNLASIYEHSLQPAISKGGVNQGELVFARRDTFNIYKMSIKKEMAQVIDAYFSRFGYKVNEIKTPNILSRTKFNFIKVGGMDELVTGNIPASDLEKINQIFRKGVTIFHNYSDFGNYTISNPIVTP